MRTRHLTVVGLLASVLAAGLITGCGQGTGTPARIAVVTDCAAYLPDTLVAQAGLAVSPLAVAISGEPGLEGVDVTPADVAQAVVARRGEGTTSRPTPEAFVRAYQDLVDAG